MSADALDPVDAVVCDLDGVVYRGDEAIDGAAEAIGRLRAMGVRLAFCTNHAGLTPAQCIEKLARLGVRVGPDELVTSAVATAEALDQRGFGGRRAMVIGEAGTREALQAVGIELIDDPTDRAVDLVVVGFDEQFDYAAMRRASLAIRDGATFIATNGDAVIPRADGLWPETGAICASIELASGVAPETMGKPHLPMMQAAQARVGAGASTVMVGDMPATDLAGGMLMGWRTVLVLSGATSAEQAEALEPRPDMVLASLGDLPRAIRTG